MEVKIEEIKPEIEKKARKKIKENKNKLQIKVKDKIK